MNNYGDFFFQYDSFFPVTEIKQCSLEVPCLLAITAFQLMKPLGVKTGSHHMSYVEQKAASHLMEYQATLDYETMMT